MDDSRARLAGSAAVAMAGASLLLAPLNALARMRTESGRSDFESGLAHWWAAPAMDFFEPILGFAPPDTVYVTYGKFYVFALLAVLACALAVRGRRPDRPGWSERWGWRITLASYVLMAAGMFVGYWIAPVVVEHAPRVTDGIDAFYLVILLGMLGTVFGHVLLGIALIRGRFRPRLSAWALVTEPVTSIALVSISTQALGMWPMMLAWGVAGWSLWRSDARSPVRQPVAA
jgi:hypothetical protein